MKNTHFTHKAAGGSIRRQEYNPDLLEERAKATFDPEEVKQMIYIPGTLEFYKRIASDMRQHEELKPTHEYFEMSREEQMKWHWTKLAKCCEVDPSLYMYNLVSATYQPCGLDPGQQPWLLHFGMFQSGIRKLGNDSQAEAWDKDIRTLKVLGCYAQTELGHGSNVAGIETTATLDMNTDEFVIHSPTPTSTKYWPGGLGIWANHALVFARCIVEENDYGVTAFIVPIRSQETHEPLRGVKVGDIGQKFGYQSKDNGWLMFDHVRIPRTNMMARYSYIDKEGTFEIRGNPKGIYQTMVEIRYQIVAQAGHYIRKALVIGMRYAACRRQFQSVSGSTIERKILDYQSHMFKFGPLLSESYVMCTMGVYLHTQREIMNAEVKQGKYKSLDLLHHLTSGLKSIYSQMAYDGIELVRVNCGGAGFSVWSGLPQIFQDYSPVPVYEGDNTVMAQQTFGYINKKLAKLKEGYKPPKLFMYLADLDKLVKLKRQAFTLDEFLELGHLETALKVRAAYHVSDVLTKMAESKEKKKVKINDLFAQDLLMASRAHMMYLSFYIYRKESQYRAFNDSNIRPLLILMAKIFALKQLTLDSTACYETGFFGPGSKTLLLDAMKKLVVELRPHMIPLVELNVDELIDMSHLSAIGNKYGDIYEAQLERAMNSRLNQKSKPDYWDSLVKPLMGKPIPEAKL